MKTLILFLFSLVTLFSSQSVISQSINLPHQFHKHFIGSLNKTIKINMELMGTKNKLSGSYYYQKIGKNLWLSGKYDKTGKIEMIESNGGKMTGKFEGIFQSDKCITGTWSDSAGTKKIPFILNEDYSKSVQLEVDTAVVQYNLFNNPEKPVYEISVFMAYPIYSENQETLQKVKDIVERAFFGETIQGNNIKEKIDNFITNRVNMYKENEKDYAENNPDGESDHIYNWMTDISNSFLLNDFGILSVGYYTSEFTGGAHGNYSQIYQVIDMASGNLVQLTDFLQEGFEPVINEFLTKSFKEQNKTESLTEVGYYSDSITFTQNFFLTKEGIYFTYNPYEIAPYMMGPQEALIPFTELKKWIKPNSIIKELLGN